MNIIEYQDMSEELLDLRQNWDLAMPMKKIAISLPEPVLETIDQLAEHRGESRSHVIATLLSKVARVKRDRDITRQLDALFDDKTISAEQKRTADEFLRLGSWTEEKW